MLFEWAFFVLFKLRLGYFTSLFSWIICHLFLGLNCFQTIWTISCITSWMPSCILIFLYDLWLGVCLTELFSALWFSLWFWLNRLLTSVLHEFPFYSWFLSRLPFWLSYFMFFDFSSGFCLDCLLDWIISSSLISFVIFEGLSSRLCRFVLFDFLNDFDWAISLTGLIHDLF